MPARIDREAVVSRHTIVVHEPNPEHVVSVGNGDFAYTADITGMQTFAAYHDPLRNMLSGTTAINTATMSTWGWHEMPNPEGFSLSDAMSEYATPRGPVAYPDKYDMQAAMQGALPDEHRPGAWLHANPQRLDLGRVGLALRRTPGKEPITSPEGLSDTTLTNDLWRGRVESSFHFEGVPVHVRTVASPHDSVVAFRIESALLREGRLAVSLAFPYAHDGFFQTDDWERPAQHASTLQQAAEGTFAIIREVDATTYRVDVRHSSGQVTAGTEPHRFEITSDQAQVDVVIRFSPDDNSEVPSFDEVLRDAEQRWSRFWNDGASIDFTGSSDPRAHELERRVVLSQYLTAVHGSGVNPPAETGLLTNSWQGKFHLEMHFWHAAHFAAWGRPELLRPSLDWYLSILVEAKATAQRQHYRGARWPKQVGPEGRESPEPTGSLLVWQQPHLLFLLELTWRASSADERTALVEVFADAVDATVEFMVDFVELRDGEFHLPAPLMPAQEFYDSRTTEDPTFELAYWWWGIEIGQRWRERRGLDRDPGTNQVQTHLVTPRRNETGYAAVGTTDEIRRDDHPSLLGALGFVPLTPLIDTVVMRNTLEDVLARWDWDSAWGWDFPLMAMTAHRLGDKNLAVDVLLRPERKNHHTVVGHNPQMGALLPAYLPGNGALLAAVSLLAGPSDDGAPHSFPADGWVVATEGFVSWPDT
ncbi:hypothetical protein [Curtobacterium sp. ISL-83]|uniref:hypothetical protein n=1 Tax=Curtobacterium sp. ISL-83 TaxID=2819145 RepID=UPI001BE945A4|nr:hypothetical protein [Curtobacterium sp. ISL-83]MBT2502333.1 hypothetical protein [Curtobacterium sp. ISL-83]